MTAVLEQSTEIDIDFPRKFVPVLTSKKRIIVLIGGRGSTKSQSISQFLLSKVHGEGSDLLCGREFQTSIEDSVHKLNLEMIERLQIRGVADTDKKINFSNGGKVRYKGFARNSSAVRSAQGFRRAWIEEAQSLSSASIKDLLPTIRGKGSQLFFSANLMASTDPFSVRFYMPFKKELDRDGIYEDEMHLIIIMNYNDNPWWDESELELDRKWDYENLPRAEYDHVWGGKCNDSVENSIIKAEWFDAAIDAHIKLGFEPKGLKIVSHDPSDSVDPRGLVYRHGSVIVDAMEKKDGDVNDGCDWATDYAIANNVDIFSWDCDGLGVSLKRQVNDALEGKKIEVVMFKGSEGVVDPGKIYQPDERIERRKAKTNKETFKNKRAQYSIRLRDRFYNTYRATVKGEYIDPDELISVSSKIKTIDQFRSETCRIPRKINGNGFIQIMTKEEMKRIHKIESPNMYDCAMMSMEEPTPIEGDRVLNLPNAVTTFSNRSNRGYY